MKKPFVLVAILAMAFTGCSQAPRVTPAALPDIAKNNSNYTGNKAPLLNSPFIQLPVGSVKPKGWLLKQLELQADGYFGHLGEISKYLIKENNSWLSADGSGDHGWEEVPYWLKGYSNLAWTLGRKEMIEEAQIWIEAVFKSQKADGWFGPDKGRTGAYADQTGRDDLWPNMPMLYVLQDYYTWSNDERVITLMTRYFNYLKTIPEEKFLAGYWQTNRGGNLLYSVYWLYNRTGDAALLDLAQKIHRKSVNWTDSIANLHNVNMAQSFGEPTTYYLQSHDSKHLKASERNYQEIRELYGQVPGGMFAGDENCRPGHSDPRQAVETCGMVEMMLSTEVLYTITGDPSWADICEDVAFNSYPAALNAEMTALRYLTSPNLVQSDTVSKSPVIENGGPMFLYTPHRNRCCQHNQGQGWPYFTEHLWLATADNGLAAALYAENEVTAKVGNGTSVTISEKTKYPFEGKIELTVNPAESVIFPLYLRIPGWCKKPEVMINGKKFPLENVSELIKIEKTWKKGDVVSLTLPMEVGLRTWTANKNSVSVDYGPLTFSLKIEENWVRDGGTDQWPTWVVYPASPWNYGLQIDESDLAKSFIVTKKEYPSSEMPFTLANAPIEIRATGKKIPAWTMDEHFLVGELPVSPVVTDQQAEPVLLVPMGAARLRISSFPVVKK
ncbi:MAG: glycoside hydrolase family 127 protein [Bacteroidales bacterium]|nr:glycoside hydrolase family 127 protein [Bacteroidales bacterium]